MSKMGLILALAALVGAGAVAILVRANSPSKDYAVVKSAGKSCCDGH